MTESPAVDILMSTYNGEKFLPAQMESLFAQTHANWALHVRDDGSTDGTAAMLEEYARQDARVRIVRDSLGNLRPTRSFLRLASLSSAEYFMFCDQDDVWLPHKISLMLEAIRKYGNQPALVFTDLEVVDQQLRPVHPSYMEHSVLNPVDGLSFGRLLMQNVAPGCAMMCNRALGEVCRFDKPLAGPIFMHDWWIMLRASLSGRIHYIPQATIKYRQHGGNASGGSRGVTWMRLLKSFASRNTPWRQSQHYVWRIAHQARTLLATDGQAMSKDQMLLAQRVASLSGGFVPWHALRCFRRGIRCQSFRLNAALVVFTWPPVVGAPVSF